MRILSPYLPLVLAMTLAAATRAEPPATSADERSVVVYAGGEAVRAVEATEPQPRLYALDLVDPAWLNGPRFHVAEATPLTGAFPVFAVRSDYGPMEVVGVELLAIRVEEFQALAEVDRLSKLDVFTKSASNSVKRTARALRNVLSSPIETLKAVPKAIGRKARETYEDAREGAKNLADQAREGMRNDDGDPIAANPFLPPPPPQVDYTPEEKQALREEQAKQVGKKAGLSYIGYNKARRDLSKLLGIDPYTSNPLIQVRLDELAWASLAGSVGTNLTIGALTGGMSAVVSKSRQLNKLVWELPEPELRKRNREALKQAGFLNSASRALIRNGAFSASLQTTYVDLVVEARHIRGAQRLLELGAEARDELDARFLIQALSIALDYQREHGAFTRVRAISNQPVFEQGRRGLVVPAPADYLYLSAELRRFLDLEEFRNTDNVLLPRGKLSPRLAEELSIRRWDVQPAVDGQLELPYAAHES